MCEITLHFLEKHGACQQALNRFRRLFGLSVEVTAENIKRWRSASVKEGLEGQDPGWVLWYILRYNSKLGVEFATHVDPTNGENKYYGFAEATREVGRDYSDKRCAAAITQAIRAVGRYSC